MESDGIPPSSDFVLDEDELLAIQEIERAAANRTNKPATSTRPTSTVRPPPNPAPTSNAFVLRKALPQAVAKSSDLTNTTNNHVDPFKRPLHKGVVLNEASSAVNQQTLPFKPVHRGIDKVPSQPKRRPAASPQSVGQSPGQAIDIDAPIDLCSDDWNDLSEETFRAIDEISANHNRKNAQASSSKIAGTSTTNRPLTSIPTTSRSATTSLQTHLHFQPLGRKKQGKTWDRTAYTETGRRIPSNKGKSKQKKKKRVYSFTNARGKDDDSDEDDDDDEDLDADFEAGFDQFPLPFIDPNKPPPEQRHHALPSIAPTYLYPTNVPVRKYQSEIVASCFLDNTLVALPTGLGKTFIAGTVMLNCERTFHIMLSNAYKAHLPYD